jgi:exopolysaccharide production protein ExoZ
MVHTTISAWEAPDAPKRFALRRIIRVVPLYYIFTTLMIAALFVFPEAIGKTTIDVKQFISSYLFWPYAREDGRISPVLSLGWTLNYEMFFYALFTAALFLPRKFGLAALSFVMLALPLVGLILPGRGTALEFYTNSIIIEFLLGAWIALAFSRLPSISTRPAFALSSIGLGIAAASLMHVYAPDSWPRLITQGFPAALIVLGSTLFISNEDASKIPSPLLALGDSSYALYLSHRFPMRAITMVFGATVGFSPGFAGLYFVCVIASCLIFAHIVYLFLEKPLLKKTSGIIPGILAWTGSRPVSGPKA